MPDPSGSEVPARSPPRDRGEALRAVAEAVGGTLIEGKVKGGFFVAVEHGSWTLTLDLHMVQAGSVSTLHTRVVAFFSGRDDLKLTVRPRTFIDAIGAKLGLGGLIAGDRDFTRRYVLRGRPESRVRSIISGGLGDALAVRGPLRVEVKRAPRRRRKTMGPHARQLQVLAPGVDTDVDRMVGLFAVGRAAMDVLGRIGSASSEPAR